MKPLLPPHLRDFSQFLRSKLPWNTNWKARSDEVMAEWARVLVEIEDLLEATSGFPFDRNGDSR